MSKKKHTLKIDSTTEFIALGIASTESEFQLSLSINSLLSVKLTSQPIIKGLKSETISFPCFRFDNEDELQVVIFKNKNKGNILFPNQQSFDFIVLLSGLEASKKESIIQNELKSLADITLISPVDPKKLGNIKSLIQ